MQRMKGLLVTGIVLLAIAPLPVLADTKLTMEEGTAISADAGELPEGMREAFANQQPTTAVYWFAKDRAARVSASGSMISHPEEGKSYFVNHQSRSYTILELGDAGGSAVASGTAEMVKTDETRKIDSWNTVRYDMTLEVAGETSEITLWVTDEINVDVSGYEALVRATATQAGFDWMLQLLEVDGFPIRQEFRLGPIESWQQLISVSEEEAPAGTYEIPAGYIQSN